MKEHAHSTSNIKTAFLLNLFFTVFEVIGGILTNSTAILSDALHDFGDSVSLGLSLYLEKKAQKDRSSTFSYGFKRLSLLSGLISSLILITGSIIILSESIPRLMNPEHTNAKGMLGLAIVGILINGFAALRTRSGKTVNEEVITWHLLEDVLGWIAVFVTSLVMMFFDLHILDPLLSIAITLFVLWNVGKKLKYTLKIFLQAVPSNLSIRGIEKKLMSLASVKLVHDTHLWSLDGENHVLSTHLVLQKNLSISEALDVKCRAKEVIQKMGISHATVEIEKENESCNLKNH